MVAYQCGITLPRYENGKYVSLLDECGGHAGYHFHERLKCLYSATGAHSDKVGEATDGTPLYGKWEDADKKALPELDACGGHYGVTPDSNGDVVYHYHVQDAAPFTFGCLGPNDDGSLVTVQQCRDFYPGCDGDTVEITTKDGTVDYDLWCPCYDANGSNNGVSIAELAVFANSGSTTGTGSNAGSNDASNDNDTTLAPATTLAPTTLAPTTTAAPTTLAPVDTCSAHAGKSWKCKKAGCWYDKKSKSCHAEKDCSVGKKKGYCTKKLKCKWDRQAKLCFA